MNIEILKLGSDPEFLLKDKYTGKLVSSIGIIPGTKEEPLRLNGLGDFYTIQIDNVLGEISVGPSETGDGLWENIQKTLDIVKKEFLPENIEIVHQSSGIYSDEELDNPIAKVLGCSPSLNAWSFGDNPAPSSESNFRGCGCHFHISYKDPTFYTSFIIGQVFDLFGTLKSVVRDPDTKRREFYGKAGEIRMVDYGVELRTPGGFTISSKLEFDFMIDAIYKTVEFINSGKKIEESDAAQIQLAINTNNKSRAEELIQKYSN